MPQEDPLTSLLDLTRRLPPHNIEANLDLLCSVLPPDLADDLLASVDQPLKIKQDTTGKDYLACDYNRDGDSYRSPWTNAYDPPLADGTTPSPKLRKLESAMGDAFDVYRDMYYEGGVSSVYLWDVDDGFAGVVLLKKTNDAASSTASWDSVHVFEASERGRTAHYKLTSTVMLYLVKNVAPGQTEAEPKGEGKVELGGSMTRQTELDAPHDPSSTANNMSSHISNLGRMIEDMEGKMRNSLQEVYFSKTKDVTTTLRSSLGFQEGSKRMALQGELVGLLRGKAKVEA